jgi:xanthine dehydrogenase YagS FAD-binding subunit
LKNFEIAIPENIQQTFGYLDASQSKLKAGGIDLTDLMKEGIDQPKRLVNIRYVEDLNFIREEENGDILIGPVSTLQKVADNGLIQKNVPALAQAAGLVASPQIRNVATITGNIAQRPRCWYFRSEDFPCSRKGGDVCFALDGENQYHAIFGNADGCAIVHPSGTAPALMALNAVIHIDNGDEKGEVPIEDFFITPAVDIQKENILKANELITAIRIPAEMRNYRSYYIKHKEKETYDWPLADVAAVLKLDGMVCQKAGIVLGSAAPIPWRSVAAETVLSGQQLSKTVIRKAAEAAVAEAEPLDGNAYKVPLFKTIIYRTVCQAAGIDPMS